MYSEKGNIKNNRSKPNGLAQVGEWCDLQVEFHRVKSLGWFPL